MKTIKVKFVDFYSSFNFEESDFMRILKRHFDVVISDDPDFVIYSCFGYQHLKYDCVRIFYTGECITPDYNVCDYAIGFDYMTFQDRYCRVPLYLLFQYKADYEMALQKHLRADSIAQEDRVFCCMVVSNDNAQNARKEIFEVCSTYHKVDSGGRYLNNIGHTVKDKNAFQSQYKFSIAFENCVSDGYTTEKLLQSFAAGNIPIYYGNPQIGSEFNERAFINCHNFKDFEEVLEYIRKIDNDEELYRSILREPIQHGDEPYIAQENAFEEFLYHIFDQSPEAARRRPCNTYLSAVEKDRRIAGIYNKYWGRYVQYLTSTIRRIKNGAFWR